MNNFPPIDNSDAEDYAKRTAQLEEKIDKDEDAYHQGEF